MKNTANYNRFNDYIKKKYGQRIQKITVNAGFNCPNRDGTISFSGCTYCNNEGFSPSATTQTSLTEQIRTGIAHAKRRYNVDRFFVYFQPYSNTYGDLSLLERLYNEALNIPEVVGLCIGTRPDCVDSAKMAMIAQLAQKYEIIMEYGLESISNTTLQKINRGHDIECFINTVELTAKYGIKVCAHIIFGFPWEPADIAIKTAHTISTLPINFVKLHQLQIVKNTPLATQYYSDPFETISPDNYIEMVVNFLEHLSPEIIIQRLAAETRNDLLIAPLWPYSLQELTSKINNELISRKSYQGILVPSV